MAVFGSGFYLCMDRVLLNVLHSGSLPGTSLCHTVLMSVVLGGFLGWSPCVGPLRYFSAWGLDIWVRSMSVGFVRRSVWREQAVKEVWGVDWKLS